MKIYLKLILILAIVKTTLMLKPEDREAYKTALFDLVNEFTKDHFVKYELASSEKSGDDPSKGYFYSFGLETSEATYVESITRYVRKFYRFHENNKEKGTLIFTLVFEMNSKTDGLVMFLENKDFTIRCDFQYIQPLDQPFTRDFLKETLDNYYYRIDQIIVHFATFLDDLEKLKKLLSEQAKLDKKQGFELLEIATEANYEDTKERLTHFNIESEITSIKEKSKKNEKIFDSESQLAKLIKLETPTDEDLKDEFVILKFNPNNEKYLRFDAIEVLCYYHARRGVFTIKMKTHYFTFESDLNIMTRGFVLGTILHNLKIIEKEVYEILIELQNSKNSNFLTKSLEDRLGNQFAIDENLQKIIGEPFKCLASNIHGIGICEKMTGEQNSELVVRGVYGIKPDLILSEDQVVEVMDDMNPEKLNEDKGKDRPSFQYVEEVIPTQSMYSMQPYWKAFVKNMLRTGDGNLPSLEDDEKSELVDKDLFPELWQLITKPYNEPPTCTSSLSTQSTQQSLKDFASGNTILLYDLDLAMQDGDLITSWRRIDIPQGLRAIVENPEHDFSKSKENKANRSMENEKKTDDSLKEEGQIQTGDAKRDDPKSIKGVSENENEESVLILKEKDGNELKKKSSKRGLIDGNNRQSGLYPKWINKQISPNRKLRLDMPETMRKWVDEKENAFNSMLKNKLFRIRNVDLKNFETVKQKSKQIEKATIDNKFADLSSKSFLTKRSGLRKNFLSLDSTFDESFKVVSPKIFDLPNDLANNSSAEDIIRIGTMKKYKPVI